MNKQRFSAALFFVALLGTFSSLCQASQYTLENLLTLMDNRALTNFILAKSSSQMIFEVFSDCNSSSIPKSESAFSNTIEKFGSASNLVTSLVTTWAETDENRALKIEIDLYQDVKEIYFDEGLSIYFDRKNELLAIKHWDHYSFGASKSYKGIFDGISGVVASDEHALFFKGICKGKLTN